MDSSWRRNWEKKWKEQNAEEIERAKQEKQIIAQRGGNMIEWLKRGPVWSFRNLDHGVPRHAISSLKILIYCGSN